MFTKSPIVEFNFYPFLESFLFILAKQNPNIFKQYENINFNKEVIEEVLPFNDIHYAEQKLHTLLENNTHKLGLPLEASVSNVGSEINNINDLYINNKEIFESNKEFYKSYVRHNNLISKSDLVQHLKKLNLSDEVIIRHKDLIERPKKIILIPSIYIYPQTGFNLIDDTLYLLIGVRKENFKEELDIETLAACFSSLSEPNRLKILKLISNNSNTIAKELANELSLTNATVSHHLSALAQAGIVSREKSGRKYTYKLEHSRLNMLSEFLKTLK